MHKEQTPPEPKDCELLLVGLLYDRKAFTPITGVPFPAVTQGMKAYRPSKPEAQYTCFRLNLALKAMPAEVCLSAAQLRQAEQETDEWRAQEFTLVSLTDAGKSLYSLNADYIKKLQKRHKPH